MDITITLHTEPGAAPEERAVRAGTSVEELLLEYRSHLPYRVITAKVDGDDVPLGFTLEKDCDVTFCDIRENTANRTFQRGLCFVYLKAVRETLGPDVQVTIESSVNRGLYTTIKGGRLQAVPTGGRQDAAPTVLFGADLRRIEKRMWEIVDANLPITTTTVGKADLFGYLRRIGADEKLDLLQNAPDVHYISVAHLDGYTNYFYGILPPSTGYAQPFALDPYHGGVLLRFPHPSDPSRIAQYTKDDHIFAAYEEEQRALEAAGLTTISDLDRAVTQGRAKEIIETFEARHADKIAALAHEIAASKKRVVLLAGPSSSGKTTTSKRLIAALAENEGVPCLYLGTDDFFVEREDAPKDSKGEYNFEGLDAMDTELFARTINALLAGEPADIPRFDFLTGKKVFGERTETLAAGALVLVEGIHALNRRMSKGIPEAEKFKVYISPLTQLNIDDHNRVPSTDVRLIRRMLRDHRTRGYDVRDTIKSWPKVRDGESVNIFPYNDEADAVFNSTLVYELPVMRRYVEPLLEEIRPGDPEYGHAKWLLYFLRFFTPVAAADEAAIPKESILREFIGGGILEEET
ncbi:MAG: nucleoside kinase [Clostridiales Family XIII bacterium]|jgi:uridine kinase|nr:nucleoside kinase [Clostridiales Family XIII bacterium]